LFVLALTVHAGLAQSVAVNGMRGTTSIDDDLSDDDQDLALPGLEDGTETSDPADPNGVTSGPRSRPGATAATGTGATRRNTGRPEPQRAVTAVQPGPYNPDGTPVERTGSIQTATVPEDNFDDDQDAYEPLGLRVGSFIVRSSIESTIGFSDNVNREYGGKSGGLYRLRPQFDIRSDWNRHQLNVILGGEYDGYFDKSVGNEHSVDATATGRIDVRDSTRVDLEAGYQYDPEDPSSAEVAPGSTAGGVHTLTGKAGVTQDIRRFRTTLSGEVTREEYTGGTDDGRRSTGAGRSASDDRDNTLVEGTLRLGYQVSPAVMPYVEGSLFARHFDREQDSSGIRRASDGYSLRGGVTVDLGSKLSGDLALGWRREKLHDRRMDPLEGPTIDGTVTWSPRRLTSVSFTGTTSFDTTTLDRSPGSVEYKGTLAVAQSLRRNVRLDASVGLSYRDYESSPLTEWRREAALSVEWSFNRNVAAVARYRYEDLDSSSPRSDYSANTVEIGMTLRH